MNAELNLIEISAELSPSLITAEISQPEPLVAILNRGIAGVPGIGLPGGTFVHPQGLVFASAAPVWYCKDRPVVVKHVKSIRPDGTGATVNARRLRAGVRANHLGADLSLAAADTLTDGGTVINTDYAPGDVMEIVLASASGRPTAVGIWVEVDYQ